MHRTTPITVISSSENEEEEEEEEEETTQQGQRRATLVIKKNNTIINKTKRAAETNTKRGSSHAVRSTLNGHADHGDGADESDDVEFEFEENDDEPLLASSSSASDLTGRDGNVVNERQQQKQQPKRKEERQQKELANRKVQGEKRMGEKRTRNVEETKHPRPSPKKKAKRSPSNANTTSVKDRSKVGPSRGYSDDESEQIEDDSDEMDRIMFGGPLVQPPSPQRVTKRKRFRKLTSFINSLDKVKKSSSISKRRAKSKKVLELSGSDSDSDSSSEDGLHAGTRMAQTSIDSFVRPSPGTTRKKDAVAKKRDNNAHNSDYSFDSDSDNSLLDLLSSDSEMDLEKEKKKKSKGSHNFLVQSDSDESDLDESYSDESELSSEDEDDSADGNDDASDTSGNFENYFHSDGPLLRSAFRDKPKNFSRKTQMINEAHNEKTKKERKKTKKEQKKKKVIKLSSQTTHNRNEKRQYAKRTAEQEKRNRELLSADHLKFIDLDNDDNDESGIECDSYGSYSDDDITIIKDVSQSTIGNTEKEREETEKRKQQNRIVNLSKEDNEKFILLPSRLASLLKPHQLNGIRFCWNNIVQPKRDKLQGCVLAHSMGLGKTLQMVSFVHVFIREKFGKHVLVVCPKSVVNNWDREFSKWARIAKMNRTMVHLVDDNVKDTYGRTEVLKQWKKYGGVLIIGYHMFSRLIHPKHNTDLSGIRLKLHNLAVKILSKPGPDLVIVDEGHILKNDKTQMNEAISTIQTRRRIILTGTPLQNHLMEYFTMIDFVRPGMWQKAEFKSYFADPIKEGFKVDSTKNEIQFMKHRSFVLVEEMRDFVDRQDQSILRKDLPPKHEYVVSIKINKFQRSLYRAFLKCNENLSWRKNVLYYCAMLHKVINHPDLLRLFCKRNMIMIDNDEETTDQHRTNHADGQTSLNFSVVGRDQSKKSPSQLIDLSQSDDDVNDDDDGYNHSDVEQILPMPNLNTGQSVKGKEDEEMRQRRRAVADILGLELPISVRRMKPLPPKRKRKKAQSKNQQIELQNLEEMEDEATMSTTDYSWVLPVLVKEYQAQVAAYSSKVQFLIRLLEEALRRDEKVLVFSQFCETLTVIEDILSHTEMTVNTRGTRRSLKRNTDYSRLDGTMSNKERESLIKAFNATGSRKKLFLISTRAGGLGINLTAATRVVLFDCCFDPSNDTQSIFRAYRYGQTKPVFVYRLIGAGTVEEAIWKKCMAKGWLFKRVVDDKTPVRLLTTDDLNLYAFDQSSELSVSTELDVSVFSDDDILLKICESEEFKKMIQKVEEHDSLFVDDLKDKLTEEEKIQAKENHKAYKEGVPMTHSSLSLSQDVVQIQNHNGSQNHSMGQASIRYLKQHPYYSDMSGGRPSPVPETNSMGILPATMYHMPQQSMTNTLRQEILNNHSRPLLTNPAQTMPTAFSLNLMSNPYNSNAGGRLSNNRSSTNSNNNNNNVQFVNGIASLEPSPSPLSTSGGGAQSYIFGNSGVSRRVERPNGNTRYTQMRPMSTYTPSARNTQSQSLPQISQPWSFSQSSQPWSFSQSSQPWSFSQSSQQQQQSQPSTTAATTTNEQSKNSNRQP